ncbi:MAG: hypothetical protein DDT34_00656 [Firmicutes bacterium]|nr:hypothetical protein [Bacillota bacterium]MBT9157377.1 hypothetical protein [Bacillota bacterium]
MNLRSIVEALQLEVLTGDDLLDRPISGGYISDMLSDVLAHAAPDCLWVTRQAHQNVIAVASLLGLGAVVLVNCPIPAALIEKARAENLVLVQSDRMAFELAGQLYALGLRGCRRD